MSCERARQDLSAWIDGELAPAEQAATETHLQTCASCRSAAADLRAIREAAAGLAEEPVSGDGWSGIEASLRARRRPAWPRFAIALAAAAVLVAVVGLTLLRRGDDGSSAERRAREELALLQRQQQRAVAALQSVVQRRSAAWDPSLRQTFASSEALVDAALDECRRALGRRPDDLTLRASLMEAYQRKVELLKMFSGLEDAP